HRLSPGRLALRPRARPRRADAARRAARRGGGAECRADPAAQRLWLVHKDRARDLHAEQRRRRGVDPLRSRCRRASGGIGSGTPMPGRSLMITEFSEERQKRLILDYFSRDARIRLLRRAPTFGAPVFVVDFDRGTRHFRTLGSFGGAAQVTEQSSMDLLYPARLVFHYERLMSLAFAMVERPVTALLLGVGGAAMWRFLRAYLPDCSPTLVDSDETIITLARRWF